MTADENWEHSVDVLVVGSGNGGLTAALCCYEMGTEDVLLIDKSDMYGGTSAISGGGVWVPNNRYAKAAGADDNPQDARSYLMGCLPLEKVPEEMIDTYLEHAPRMVDFLHERTRVRYVTLEHYPDYYQACAGAKPGHRSMEPEPINAEELGKEYRKLRRSHHMMHLFGRVPFTQVEAALLMAQLPGWFQLALSLVLKYFLDIPWRLFGDKYARRLTTGSAGVARLLASMQDRNMPIWLQTSMKSLITENGRVVGALVEKDGRELRINARKAVVLAAGGF